jgi:hypothetical protein
MTSSVSVRPLVVWETPQAHYLVGDTIEHEDKRYKITERIWRGPALLVLVLNKSW